MAKPSYLPAEVTTYWDPDEGRVVYPGGHVIQCQNTYVVDPSDQALAANTTYDITGMSVNITPSSSTSKIILQARWCGEMSSVSSAGWNTMFLFRRDGTEFGLPPQPGSLSGLGHMPTFMGYYAADNDSTMESCMWDSVDYPSTTSTVTYTAAVRNAWDAYTLYNNRCVNPVTTGNYERGTSMITVWEIAG
jgi:hypothetical protein